MIRILFAKDLTASAIFKRKRRRQGVTGERERRNESRLSFLLPSGHGLLLCARASRNVTNEAYDANLIGLIYAAFVCVITQRSREERCVTMEKTVGRRPSHAC